MHLNVGTSNAFVWDMMNTTEIEVNDNDAAPLSSVSPASSFRDSSPTHNKRRNIETNTKDAIDEIKFFRVCNILRKMITKIVL